MKTQTNYTLYIYVREDGQEDDIERSQYWNTLRRGGISTDNACTSIEIDTSPDTSINIHIVRTFDLTEADIAVLVYIPNDQTSIEEATYWAEKTRNVPTTVFVGWTQGILSWEKSSELYLGDGAYSVIMCEDTWNPIFDILPLDDGDRNAFEDALESTYNC